MSSQSLGDIESVAIVLGSVLWYIMNMTKPQSCMPLVRPQPAEPSLFFIFTFVTEFGG